MRLSKVFLIILVAILCKQIQANEQVHFRIFIVNQFKVHNIEVYSHKRRNPAELIFKTKTKKKAIEFFEYPISNLSKIRPFEFWIYVKGKLHIGGRWICISNIYEPQKNLLVEFSPQMKRNYCYVSRWVDQGIEMKFR